MPKDLFEQASDNEPTFQEDDNQPESFLTELVGEGKKFKDTEALARGKYESDRFVQKLQDELRELREDFNQRSKLEEQVSRLEQFQSTASKREDTPSSEREPENTANMSAEEVAELIQQKIKQQKEADSQEQNLLSVKRELEKKWGSDFKRHLERRTVELGLGKEFANGLAATHPKAFLDLMVGGGVPDGYVPPATSTVRQAPSTGRKTYNDFQKLRREDPNLYHSSRVQSEMHKLAMELGEDFYK